MLCILLLFGQLFTNSKTYDHGVPRGSSLGKAPLYNPLAEFTCFDGSFTIPFSYVNDDYCDCLDGSDEPGTPACPNGIFHCMNNGYIPLNIPTSRVNDGICDCCDASDEYGTGNCSNTCATLGAEAKKQAEKLAELMVKGNQLMLELSAVGKQIKREKQERITALEIEKGEAERLKIEAEKIKTTAEEKENKALEVYRVLEETKRKEQAEREQQEAEEEALIVFKHLDSNSNAKLELGELQTRSMFDQNKDGDVSEEELRFFMDSKEELTWEEFKDSAWPRIKPFYMMEKGIFTPPQHEIQEDEESDNVDKEEEKSVQEAAEEPVKDEEEREFLDEEWDKQGVNEENEESAREDNDVDHDDPNEKNEEVVTPKYDEATQKIIEEANKARSQYEAAERAVQDLERELSQLRDSLSKDYGAADEYAPLDGQCFTYTDREYTYKLCPFDQVVQMVKSGSSETRLGSWKGWGEKGDYSTMVYDKGQSCWNGPQRSTKVFVSCGLENEVVGATEPNKCEYMLDFKSPSACRLQEAVIDTHDEL